MKSFNVAIIGATGAVGREMIKVLEERKFPVKELVLLASKRSIGIKIPFCGKEIEVKELTHDSFTNIDIVLGATPNPISKEFAPSIVKAGALFIDNSSSFRMDDDVPLVVPEINPEDAFKHKGIIANPNCSTIISLVAINAINKLSEITAINASTYQATSGAGAGGPIELMEQVKALQEGKEVQPKVFAHQIAYNVIPHIGSFLDNGYTTEEMKMQNEGRKIMHLPSLKVTCTCVRVPVIRSHSISLTVVTKDKLDIDDVKKAIAKEKGCVLADDPLKNVYPMPKDTSDQDEVFVGRIRQSIVNENGIALWCCGDQVRKGAATNAIQIAELFL